MKYLFRPAQRLHTPNEFAAVLRRRGLIRGVCLELLSIEREHGVARLGLIVPKRLVRKAVVRNLIKRQVREAFRQVVGELPSRDFVVRLAKSPKFEKDGFRNHVRTDIDQLFSRFRQSVATKISS